MSRRRSIPPSTVLRQLTLSVTRGAMAAMGYCPSGRLFEASACGVPIVSDYWEGLEQFFEPGREIVIAHGAADVVEALAMDEAQRRRIAAAARERTLASHTAERRADELVAILESARGPAEEAIGAGGRILEV